MSPLDPNSPAAREIATLWWWMLAVAGVVFLGALGLLALSWLRRRERGFPLVGESERFNTGLVVTFGMFIPVVVVSAVFVVSNLIVIRSTEPPPAAETAMTVVAVGHQWFWEIRYPGGAGAVTANEIHIPVDTSVNLVARTDDVIHSFWVPELNRKVDMVPGRTNRIELYAEEEGTFRGQCAEFCGLQHANMAFLVIAEPREDFERWLERMASPAQPSRDAPARRGQEVFTANACGSCHTIRGTEARGDVGPDLTHVASRRTLAAVTIPNRHGYLNRWVRDPQSVKPGNKMPGLELPGRDFRALVSYLGGLR